MTNLDPLFSPRSIAVLGASRKPGKLGSAMARQLSTFPGTVSLVNSRGADPDHGVHAHIRDAASASGGPPELAVACLPAHLTCEALAEAAAAGCRAAVVCSGGFAEVGGPGIALQAGLAALAAETGMRILGPNTSGFVVPGRSLIASFVRGAERITPGTVGVIAASGGVSHAIAFALSAAGIGVEIAVGLGNAVDVTPADVIGHLSRSSTLTCIALHVETVQDGPVLLQAISDAVTRMPVIALVVGQSDVGDFARSHTGALATSWRTTRAALRQAGAVLVEDERQLVDAAGVLSLVRLRAGSQARTGLVTGQAGPGLLITDGLRSRGVSLPPLADKTVQTLSQLLPPLTYQLNPVDTGRPGETFGDVLNAVGSDPEVDVLAVYGLLEPDAVDLGACIASVAGGEKPVIAVIGGLRQDVQVARNRLHAAGVPVFDTPAAGVRAICALRDDARAHGMLLRAVAPGGLEAPPGRAIELSGPQNEHSLKQILQQEGVTVPDSSVCTDRQAAQDSLARIGTPVVVKMLEPVLAHKSDAGAVHLNVCTSADMDRAMAALEDLGARSVLVEAMVPGSLEILVGAHRDPVFGPVIVLGLGGITAEVMADVAVRRLPADGSPVSTASIEDMIDELALAPLLRGFRGGPHVDTKVLSHIADVVGQVLRALPSASSFEINPVRVGPGGTLVALDASLSEKTPVIQTTQE